MAVRTGQPKRHDAVAPPPPRRRASSDQAAPAGDGSSGSRHNSSSTSLCTVLPRLEVIATSGTAASHATGRLTRVARPTVASTAAVTARTWTGTTNAGGGIDGSSFMNEIGRNSAAGWWARSRKGPAASRIVSTPQSPTRSAARRRGSPGANSHPSARPAQARSLATWASAGSHRPVCAGEAQAARAGGRAVAGPPRDVGLDPVDPHRADVAATRPDPLRPGRADRDLLAGAEVLEALEDLHVAAEADRQVVPGDRPLPARAVDRHRLPAHLPGRAGVGEQPPAGERPGLEPEHPGDHEGCQERPHEPPRPRRHRLGPRRRSHVHVWQTTAPPAKPRPPWRSARATPSPAGRPPTARRC